MILCEQQELKIFDEWRLRETYMKKEFYLNCRFEGSHKHLIVKEYKVLEKEIEELKNEVAEYTEQKKRQTPRRDYGMER